jgi:hypothetical protein
MNQPHVDNQPRDDWQDLLSLLGQDNPPLPHQVREFIQDTVSPSPKAISEELQAVLHSIRECYSGPVRNGSGQPQLHQIAGNMFRQHETLQRLLASNGDEPGRLTKARAARRTRSDRRRSPRSCAGS